LSSGGRALGATLLALLALIVFTFLHEPRGPAAPSALSTLGSWFGSGGATREGEAGGDTSDANLILEPAYTAGAPVEALLVAGDAVERRSWAMFSAWLVPPSGGMRPMLRSPIDLSGAALRLSMPAFRLPPDCAPGRYQLVWRLEREGSIVASGVEVLRVEP